jgi:hypothetical protein
MDTITGCEEQQVRVEYRGNTSGIFLQGYNFKGQFHDIDQNYFPQYSNPWATQCQCST